ncbi:MAG: sulfatase [Burkholderiales bacterium]|nr:sulfatase [Burkholderiales bacterium]
MKTVFLLLDSLNRLALSPYNAEVACTPNFSRLARHAVVFDTHYTGSLPCMPARRDMLTGRLNFLHRSWGPVEPFDRCFPEFLKDADVYSHLISDHYHYWEDGGAGYHNRYSSAEFIRGQERDLWKAMVQPPMERFRERYHRMVSEVPRRQPNLINREFIKNEADYPSMQCTRAALDFLEKNGHEDNWFLQVEYFDPHEPFDAPVRFREAAKKNYHGPILDWPLYDKLDLTHDEAAELRANYAAVVAMCDENLGRILDTFDRLDLWKDTSLVLTTDHGLLLGEHEWWGKNRMPFYEPLVHIPLFIAHPSYRDLGGQRRKSLTQTLDLMPTFMDLHAVDLCTEVEGRSLMPTLRSDEAVRSAALFGIFGGSVNVTDGRYTYFRYPANPRESELNEYTLMPMHPASYFTLDEMKGAELLNAPFGFCHGFPLMKIPALDQAKRPPMQGGVFEDARNALYDLKEDAAQARPIEDAQLTRRMVELLNRHMAIHEAPVELYARFGLAPVDPGQGDRGA